MRLSKKFLSDYLDVSGLSFNELAEKMILIGNEYDSVEKLSSATNCVVGYVEEIKEHPDSDHLHVCQVKINDNEITQIVCGAPNVDKGQKVIVALPGAILPGNFEIKKGVIRGEESNGMICSLGELGIDSKYLSEEDKNGIHALENDAPIGIDAISYLGYDDEVIDFELTSNRSDLLSIIGMAYEVNSIIDSKVEIKEDIISREVEDINDYLSINVNTDKCPLYIARMVKNVVIKESPLFIKNRLIASGIRPINNVVDISNYVMLEYGQPLHFFDYDKLNKVINVRMANNNEKIVTLDQIERALTEEDIVICNDKEAICLAGVMGGLNSEVDNNTVNVAIEAAIFDSFNVRKTSNNILRSEASNRFEKGIDYKRTYMAINRAVYLLEKYADALVIKGQLVHNKIEYKEKIVEVTLDKINSVLGLNLTVEEVISALSKLTLEATYNNDKFTINIPSRRLDLNIKEDIIEEVGRIHGINNIIGKLPTTEAIPGSYEEEYYREKQIRKRLSSLGLTQVKTYTLTNQNNINQFNLNKVDAIILQSPMSEDRKYLRTTLIPSLLEVMNYNIARKNNDIFIYESSNIYYYDSEKNVKTKRLISGLINGVYTTNSWKNEKVIGDFYVLKGIVENILNYLGLTDRYDFVINELPSELHPYQSANIIIDREQVGIIGKVHPKLTKGNVYVFELDLDKILNIKVRNIKNKEINKYPSISKDVAFILDKDVLAGDVIKLIKKTAGRMLTNIGVFDIYTGENIDSNRKSVAFNLVFSDNTKTLTDVEVMNYFDKIIEEVKAKFNAELRDK
ncbi:MAG: phenylalanine--tRNA ligase subunit beta [Bacilli bacterium]|nr:phenylalanine--tRNA ligase subunit beta [Bacilli bacterium]